MEKLHYKIVFKDFKLSDVGVIYVPISEKGTFKKCSQNIKVFLGTIQILRKQLGWVGHGKCLLLLTRWVGGSKKDLKHAYVIFEWSLSTVKWFSKHSCTQNGLPSRL